MKSVVFADAPLREDASGTLKIPFFVSMGVALYICWLLVVLVAPSQTLLWGREEMVADRMVFLASSAVAALVIFTLRVVFSTQRGMWGLYLTALVSAVACLVAVVAYYLWQDFVFDFVCALVFYLVAGVCGSCLFLLWEEHFSLMTTQESVQLALAAACMFAGLAFVPVSLFRSYYGSIVFAGFPLISLLFYLASKKRVKNLLMKEQADDRNILAGRRRLITEAAVGSICMLVLGFTGWYVASGVFDSEGFQAFIICVMSLVLGGALAIALLAGYDKSTAYLLTGFIGPVVAIGLVLLCQDSTGAAYFALVVLWLLAINCAIVHVANVAKGARNYFRFRMGEPSFILMLDVLMFMAGFSIGRFDVTAQSFNVDPMRCLVLLAAIFVLRLMCERMMGHSSRRTYRNTADKRAVTRTGEGMPPAPPNEANAKMLGGCPQSPVLEETLERVVAEYGLSPREAEVLDFLSRGHNARSIGEKLFVTVATVKTHSHNIYAKTGTHSQQELIDLVESAARLESS